MINEIQCMICIHMFGTIVAHMLNLSQITTVFSDLLVAVVNTFVTIGQTDYPQYHIEIAL